jgi:hypothetical protein
VKALSIKREYAEAIMRGKKRIEYRTWRTTFRGLLVVHASGKGGALLGTVEVTNCIGCKGDWEWTLRNPRPFAAPIPAKGRLMLWDLSPQQEAAVKRALAAA